MVREANTRGLVETWHWTGGAAMQPRMAAAKNSRGVMMLALLQHPVSQVEIFAMLGGPSNPGIQGKFKAHHESDPQRTNRLSIVSKPRSNQADEMFAMR